MKYIQGTSCSVSLLDDAEDCEEFIDNSDCNLEIYHGRIFKDKKMVAITQKAYQRLFLDVYP